MKTKILLLTIIVFCVCSTKAQNYEIYDSSVYFVDFVPDSVINCQFNIVDSLRIDILCPALRSESSLGVSANRKRRSCPGKGSRSRRAAQFRQKAAFPRKVWRSTALLWRLSSRKCFHRLRSCKTTPKAPKAQVSISPALLEYQRPGIEP